MTHIHRNRKIIWNANSTRTNRIILNEIHSRVTRLDLKWPGWTSTWPCFKNSNIYNENYFNEIPNQFAETFLEYSSFGHLMNQMSWNSIMLYAVVRCTCTCECGSVIMSYDSCVSHSPWNNNRRYSRRHD